jgi:Methyltransferase domain
MSKTHESAVVSYSSGESIDARMQIFGLMNAYPASDEEKERSLGLFLRGSLLARILAIAELYRRIVEIPGSIFDVGTWRGQTAVVCENLRAIFEPLHFNRRIFCFDTFEGYKGFSKKDKATKLHRDGTYGVGGADYAELLRQLLVLHEKSNAMGHNHGKHRVIEGDCRQTIARFFEENPNEYVALAFFDVNSYEPTLKAFEAVWARLVPGGVAAFWQLTRDTIPAEARVYAENILGKHAHTLHRAPTYPGLCYLVKG